MFTIKLDHRARLWLRSVDEFANGGKGAVQIVADRRNAMHFATRAEALAMIELPLLAKMRLPTVVSDCKRCPP